MNEGQDRSFYVTLLSANDAQEFPDNNAARFKARLPFPLPDNPKAWEVGLVGLFILPNETPAITAKTNDSLRNLVDGLPIHTVLFHLLATLETGKLSETLQNDVTEIKVHDVLILPQAQSGVEWMHRVIDGLTQKALRKIPPRKTWWENGKKTTLTFRWDRDELVIDNKNTMHAWNKYPYFSINLTLALRMEWVGYTEGGGYRRGDNLLMELQDPQGNLPNLADDHIWSNAGWSFSSSHPMVVHGQSVHLSNVFNWRFVRLNEAFAVWNSHDLSQERAVFVYSDVVRSNLVGDTLTHLLRIASYKGQAQWWEPEHIEFHPLRGPSITIVEVNLAWSTGALLTFPRWVTSHLRLLFRRRRPNS